MMLHRMPIIERAEVFRLPSGRFIIRVTEREPIARLNGDVVVPIDREGWILPISTADFELDLPIIEVEEPYALDAVGRVKSPSVQAALHFMERLRNSGSGLYPIISVLRVGKEREISFTTVSPDYHVILAPDVSAVALSLLGEIMKKTRESGIESCTIDMRYREQVVIRPLRTGRNGKERG